MLISCWSAKGGCGTTVTAAGLALSLATTNGHGALLADLAGDLPAVLGLPEPDGPGLADWLAAGDDVPADALQRIEVPAGPALHLLPRGTGLLAPERAEVLAALLASDTRAVVADCGVADGGPGLTLAAMASVSLLVLRPCYLALRRAASAPVRPSGVILIDEPGRSLGRHDVESVLSVPVVAELVLDPAIARAVDAGLLAARLPRSYARVLRGAA